MPMMLLRPKKEKKDAINVPSFAAIHLCFYNLTIGYIGDKCWGLEVVNIKRDHMESYVNYIV